MRKALLSVFVSVLVVSMCFAQEKTADELKAEREVLKTERKSAAYQERQKKIAELKDPETTNLESVDALATNLTTALIETKKNNELIPELYKRTIGETLDGVTDVTEKKPTLEELLLLSKGIVNTTKAVTESFAGVSKASEDIKRAGMLKALRATKSVNYSKEVNSLLSSELLFQGKLVGNLIETLKSSKNL